MNGLELSRGYYEACGKPVLERDFRDLLPFLAIGFVGSGSERYGFDDEISRDHDFEPGFCIFLPPETVVDRRAAFLLERAYAKLPKTYGGVNRQPMSPVGGNRNGVFRTADFYLEKVGCPDGKLSTDAWLALPDEALAEAVNGEVFADEYGEFTAIRNALLSMPEDVRRKRIAGQVLLMGQAGQYNYTRCLRHGEYEAAQLACHAFVNAAMKVYFLLRKRYMPYYKWSFRALRELDGGRSFADRLSFLLLADGRDSAVAEKKAAVMEALSAQIIEALRDGGLSSLVHPDLERHAYAVNDGISDGNLRNLHILAAV